MMTNGDLVLLKEAVNELVRLKHGTEDSTRFLARLYASALEEWANRLGMDPVQLNRLVLMKVAVSEHCAQ
jgi:hypothetical protein